MQTGHESARSKNEVAKKRSSLKRWLIALLTPFVIAGIAGSYCGYHYQWQDINVKHPGAFKYMSQAQAEQSCWESALQGGLLLAIPAGILGLFGYASYLFFRRVTKKP